MYSPKIAEEFIPTLYLLKKKTNKPMTRLVNEAVRDYLKINYKEVNNESSQTKNKDSINNTEDNKEVDQNN